MCFSSTPQPPYVVAIFQLPSLQRPAIALHLCAFHPRHHHHHHHWEIIFVARSGASIYYRGSILAFHFGIASSDMGSVDSSHGTVALPKSVLPHLGPDTVLL